MIHKAEKCRLIRDGIFYLPFLRSFTARVSRYSIWLLMERKSSSAQAAISSQSEGESSFPNWKENLKLAVRLQQTLEVKYPTLARPISLTTGKYNESLTKGSLLIEFGTDANSLAEVHYSAELVGNALASLFNTLV